MQRTSKEQWIRFLEAAITGACSHPIPKLTGGEIAEFAAAVAHGAMLQVAQYDADRQVAIDAREAVAKAPYLSAKRPKQ